MNYSKHGVAGMKRTQDYSFLIVLIATPVLIFLYFLKWKTNTIYGDDVSLYIYQAGTHSLIDKINMDVTFQKYRPVHGLAMQFLVTFFQKDLGYYYLFNVGIQTINTFLFAGVLNLFLRSRWWSLLFGLVVGLSRFAYFNISQLLNGGALEGLAMTFFLASLYFIVKVLAANDLSSREKRMGVFSSILFANVSMYTHERYIVLFPFLILAILIFPGLRAVVKKERIVLILAALASIILNVVIKKYAYSIPFFVGSGGSMISFSLATATSFSIDAVLSIFQINSGPEYLVGAPFSSLAIFDQVAALLIAGGCLSVLVVSLIRIGKAFVKKDKAGLSHSYVLILMGILFALLLVPAVVSKRMEQRWLEASSAVFILMLVIMLSDWRWRGNYIREVVFFLFIFLFLWSDHNYLDKGSAHLYMAYSQRSAANFKMAVDKGIIHPGTRRLYIWEKRRDLNTERGLRWDLGGGGFFECYQGQFKKLVFVDSLYERSYPFPFCVFGHFNDSTDQILFLNDNINDITGYFRKDSLKFFSGTKIDELLAGNRVQYDPADLLISADSLDRFQVSGFYNQEGGMAWTNGNASIGLLGDYTVRDSVKVVLSTYLPSICANINPRVILLDEKNKEYGPVFLKRVEDKFCYTFCFRQFTTIQTIRILSDTVQGVPDLIQGSPVPKGLSFPFVSLEMKD